MQFNFKNIILISLIAIILIFQFRTDEIISFLNQKSSYNYNTPIVLAGNKLKVEIADTPATITKGLSGRPSLPRNTGMLFILPNPQDINFWMPDMHFPIDMIFLKNNQVVHIESSVPNPPLDTPREKLPTYSAGQEVDMVLEVNAGWSEKNNIQIGNQLYIEAK